MAQGDVSDDSLVRLVRCSVCKEVEDKPKILPCHQPICLPCGFKISTKKHRYTCPACGEEHLAPNGGFKYLPDSLVSLKMSARKQQKKKATDETETTGHVGRDVVSDSEDEVKTTDDEDSDAMLESDEADLAAESVEPAKTSEPVDPAKTSEPVDLAKASEPVDLAKASEPVDPAKTSEPVDPAKVSEPVDPTKTPEFVEKIKISENFLVDKIPNAAEKDHTNPPTAGSNITNATTNAMADTKASTAMKEETSDAPLSCRDDEGKGDDSSMYQTVTPDDVDLSDLKREMDNQLKAGKRWQRKAEEMVKAQTVKVEYIPEISEKSKQAISVYQQQLMLNCQQKLQGISKGLCEQKAELENSLSSLQPYVDQMKDAVKCAPQLIKKLAGKNCTAEDTAAATQLVEKINELNKVISLSQHRNIEQAADISPGDSVRLNITQVNDVEQFVHGKVTHSSIGIFVGICKRQSQTAFVRQEKETPLVIFPEQHDWEGTQFSDVRKSITKANMPYIGDRVRVKGSVVDPHFSWRGVRPKKSRGILKKIDLTATAPDGEMCVVVDFPEEKGWRGLYSEIELLPGCGFEVGDEVRVSNSIPEPSRGWAGVNGSSIGKVVKISGTKGEEELTVNFPGCKNWIAMATELELSRKPAIGEKVQVKLTADIPNRGRDGVKHEDVGQLVRVEYGSHTGMVGHVDFPNKQDLWSCQLEKLEPVRYQIPDYGPEVSEEDAHEARMLQTLLAMGAMGMRNMWGTNFW